MAQNNEIWKSFHSHLIERKLRESIVNSLEYDSQTNTLIAFTDYGHISLHQINDLQRCTSKTLYHENLPVYCSYLYENTTDSGSSKIIFTGGNDIIAWDWNTLMNCPHGTRPEGKFYRCGNSTSRSVSEIYCITGNSQLGHLYSAGSEGIVYCHDLETGLELYQFLGHQTFIHSLYYNSSSSLLYSCDSNATVFVWDPKITTNILQTTSQRREGNKSAIASYELISSIKSALFPPGTTTSSIVSLWSSSVILEPEGNFLYIGGGYNYVPNSSSSSASSPSRSAGWIASVYLGGGGGGGGEYKHDHSIITSMLTTHPIQTMCFHGNDLITGGPIPGLKYYNTSPLEEISSAPTSSNSIFALKSLSSFSSIDSESLLISGGTVPVLDIYAVKGHRARSLHLVI